MSGFKFKFKFKFNDNDGLALAEADNNIIALELTVELQLILLLPSFFSLCLCLITSSGKPSLVRIGLSALINSILIDKWPDGLRSKQLGKLGPAFGLGAGCGLGLGIGLLGGAGFGPGIPGLHVGIGIGAGCGVGLGFGYGVGKGIALDENRRYSNVGHLSRGPINFPSQKKRKEKKKEVLNALHSALREEEISSLDDLINAIDRR
nr:hypothetical protein CFP56_27667 [Quercus suber]